MCILHYNNNYNRFNANYFLLCRLCFDSDFDVNSECVEPKFKLHSSDVIVIISPQSYHVSHKKVIVIDIELHELFCHW